MRRDGIRYSLFLHGALLLFAIFGLPEIFKNHAEELPTVMTVELLPVTGQTNVKPASQKPEPPKEKPPEEVAEKAQAKKAQAESSKSEPQPKPDDVPLPDPKAVEKEKPKPPEPKEEPKPKPKDDLAAILKSVADAAKKEQGEVNKEKEAKETPTAQAEPDKSTSTSQSYDDSLPLSLSETDAIRSQIQKCWNVQAGAKDAETLKFTLRIELNPDGSVISAVLAEDKSRYASDSFFRAAVDSGIRAVKRCSPLQNLPPDKYGTWKSMEMSFDPRDMLQ